MDIGIETFPNDYSIDIATLTSRAEELGFELLWVGLPLVNPVGYYIDIYRPHIPSTGPALHGSGLRA